MKIIPKNPRRAETLVFNEAQHNTVYNLQPLFFFFFGVRMWPEIVPGFASSSPHHDQKTGGSCSPPKKTRPEHVWITTQILPIRIPTAPCQAASEFRCWVCVCAEGLNLTVKVPLYSDLSSGYTFLCGLLHQTAVINSLSPSVSHAYVPLSVKFILLLTRNQQAFLFRAV